ncbi:MAG: histidine kinase [Bacteroidetes bacterium]|nr:histidine kinase [Bacteroidota bacterium]
MQKARNTIIAQVLCWALLYFFWVMVFQKRAFAFSRTATVEFCYLIFVAANYYFNTLVTIPRFLYKKKYILFALAFLAGIFCTALLRVPLATYLNAHYFLTGKPQPGFSELFLNSFLNIFIWTVCIVAAKLMIDRMRIQKHIEEMAKEKEKAELDFLNAQFNPHFLFNSINLIYGHIDKQNIVAREMLLTFSDMLRYQLYECSSSFIDMEKEMGYIKNYVALQKARKGEQLSASLCIEENVKGFKIAPLLFIAFIENAFKYVSNSDERQNCVKISFQKQKDNLIFQCSNSKETDVNTTIEHKGIGIANAKRRLTLLYPQRHELEIKDTDDNYEVILKLQLV